MIIFINQILCTLINTEQYISSLSDFNGYKSSLKTTFSSIQKNMWNFICINNFFYYSINKVLTSVFMQGICSKAPNLFHYFKFYKPPFMNGSLNCTSTRIVLVSRNTNGKLLVYFSNVMINILAVTLYYIYCKTNCVPAIIFNLLFNFYIYFCCRT